MEELLCVDCFVSLYSFKNLCLFTSDHHSASCPHRKGCKSDVEVRLFFLPFQGSLTVRVLHLADMFLHSQYFQKLRMVSLLAATNYKTLN